MPKKIDEYGLNSSTKNYVKKRAMILALQKTLGVITPAAEKSQIHRTTHYTWCNEDPLYKKACDEIAEIALDFAESKLYSQIRENNPTCTIFYLKTKGRKRGYIESTENTNTNINIEESSNVKTAKLVEDLL